MLIYTSAAAVFFSGVILVVLLHRKWRQSRVAATLAIDTPDGIVEEQFVSIGGIDQWIGIRGEHQDNPILLVLHGGPGCSCSIFTPYIRTWEKHFTIVQWDQRGSGKTLARTGRKGTGELSIEQLIRDGIEVAEYVRTRSGKEKIFLLANSFGSLFGIEIARRRPDLFVAFVGADQNLGMVHRREENHQEVIERLRALGLHEGVRMLEKSGADPSRWTPDQFTIIARWTMKSDPVGFRRAMHLLKNGLWYAPGWNLMELVTFAVGMRYSLQTLWPEFCQYDAWRQGTAFAIPIFVFQGENDTLLPWRFVEDFLNDIAAPMTQLFLIPDAGHFAVFLEPKQALEALLTHVRPLAQTSTVEPVRIM